MKELKTLLLEDAAFYDAQMNEIKLRLYADALKGISMEDIRRAQIAYREEKGRRMMPMPADIKAFLNKEMDPRALAIATVGKIKEAISKFGWPQPTKAREHIGEDGWRVIERYGGWQAVCEKPELNIHEPNVTAQMRDAIEADLKLGRAGYDLDKPLIEQGGQKSSELGPADFTKLIKPKEIK